MVPAGAPFKERVCPSTNNTDQSDHAQAGGHSLGADVFEEITFDNARHNRKYLTKFFSRAKASISGEDEQEKTVLAARGATKCEN